jgi:hypothetical protein
LLLSIAWQIPYYWGDRTLRMYLVAMYWKFTNLVKLTFGIWDREMVEAFRIRDKADGEERGTAG